MQSYNTLSKINYFCKYILEKKGSDLKMSSICMKYGFTSVLKIVVNVFLLL